ncbi:MAG TPA: DbpA RNA binding domain-containing protein, partial [Gemmatimonadales bacterium]|nr:DbpA RNA binding domain-containing protein [Gemmatimonadales bacterium]
EVILLVPPGTEDYVAAITVGRRPINLSAAATAELDRDATLRGQVSALIEQEGAPAPLYPLAPLFERYEPHQIAAALWQLWRGASAAAAPRAPAPSAALLTPAAGAVTARVWVGVGKKDEATVGDLVAVLVKEVGINRMLIGKIEMRDTFAVIEVPAQEAERIARGLTGLTIRRRKLAARIDQGVQRSGPARRR